MYGHSKQSIRQVRFRPGHFSAARTCTSTCTLGFNNTIMWSCTGIKTIKPGLLQKASHHWTDIIPVLTKVNVPSGLSTTSVYSMNNSFTVTSMLPIAGQHIFNVTNQIFTRDTQCANDLAPRTSAFCPRISQVYFLRSQSMYPGNQTSLTM